MDNNYRNSDPPFSSTEKGECEHCAVTKYCDGRVEDSSFTIKSERERRLKRGAYIPQKIRNSNKMGNKLKKTTILLAIMVLILITFLVLLF